MMHPNIFGALIEATRSEIERLDQRIAALDAEPVKPKEIHQQRLERVTALLDAWMPLPPPKEELPPAAAAAKPTPTSHANAPTPARATTPYAAATPLPRAAARAAAAPSSSAPKSTASAAPPSTFAPKSRAALAAQRVAELQAQLAGSTPYSQRRR